MSRNPLLAGIGAVLIASLAAAPKPRATHVENYLPPNDMKIPVHAFGVLDAATGLTQDQYAQVLDRIEAIYRPIVAARGGNLVINRLWDNETVNSQARREGNDYVIDSYGGLARFPGMTQDGLALIACHEMGHHLGGAPKDGIDTWASVEGQADYFANLKCLRRVFSDAESDGFTRSAAVDALAQQSCAQSFAQAADQAICARAATAGVAMAQLFKQKADPMPESNTPDKTVVKRTSGDHPPAQCRLDTYLQASLCAQPTSAELSDTDPSAGACTRSQGFTVGMRPLCWYKPSKSESAHGADNVTIAAVARPAGLPTSDAFSALQNPSLWSGL